MIEDGAVEKVYEFNYVKVIYIVDYQQFDCVIDLGCKITIRQRISVRGLMEVNYKDWSKVKRILSDMLLGKNIQLKTYNSKKFYGIYEADIFIEGECVNPLLNKQIQELTIQQ